MQLAILTDDGEEILTPNTIGEVCIRGENVAASYHNRPVGSPPSPQTWTILEQDGPDHLGL